MRELSSFSASIAFQSLTAKRTRFASMETVPENIYLVSIMFSWNYEVEKRRRHAYLKLDLSAQKRNSKVIHGTGLERGMVPIPPLHEMVVGHPFHGGRVGALVHGRWVQDHRLIIGDVAPAAAFARKELGVEAPGGDGVDDEVI